MECHVISRVMKMTPDTGARVSCSRLPRESDQLQTVARVALSDEHPIQSIRRCQPALDRRRRGKTREIFS